MGFVRAKGPDGATFTVDEGAVETLGATIVDEPAVDINGRPLPHQPAPPTKSTTRATSTDLKES